jgi:hypothetical protein
MPQIADGTLLLVGSRLPDCADSTLLTAAAPDAACQFANSRPRIVPARRSHGRAVVRRAWAQRGPRSGRTSILA